MELRLNHLNKSEPLWVFVDDQLVGEVTISEWQGRDGLAAEVENARRLQALPVVFQSVLRNLRKSGGAYDGANPLPAAKQAAYGQGLIAALDGRESAQDPSPSYEAGYAAGRALQGILRAIAACQEDAA